MGARVLSMPNIGDKFINTKGSWCEVINYEGHKKVTVRFLDNYEYVAVFPTHRLKNGKFKNLYYPSVHGVGFLGEGVHKVRQDGKLTEVYKTWVGMFSRCYSKSYLDKQPSYIGCTVSSKFHNFQLFGDWYVKQEYSNKGYHLDKDILIQGNKIYSPDTCCLVPEEINAAVCGSKIIGVDKFGTSKRLNGKYQLKYSEFGLRVHLGDFDSFEEATLCYIENKTSYIHKIAEVYKDIISKDVYDSLRVWKVNITNLGELSV